jgi:hypothetical protein
LTPRRQIGVVLAFSRRACGTGQPGNAHDVLFNSEGIITAHAAANLGSPADYPFDQISERYPNRVRIGFISSLSSGLDEFGRGPVSKAEQFPADGDADVYLNWGCEVGEVPPTCAEPHYQIAAAFGLGAGTVSIMSSSYVSPLGLARLVNLRYANHAAAPMTNDLVRLLKQEITPALCGDGHDQPCVFQDPIAHRQLEIDRLGYQ